MRALLVLLIIALVAFSAFNYLQVTRLERQVTRLERQVTQLQLQLHQQPTADESDKALAEATQALARAREAFAHMDGRSARGYVDAARLKLDEAGKRAGEKTRTAVKWLGEQTSELGRKIQERAGARG